MLTRDDVRTTGPKVLAVASNDPTDPATWSGIPHQMLGALVRLGVEVDPLDTSFGRLEPIANLVSGLPNVRRVSQVFGSATPRRIAWSGASSGRWGGRRDAKIARRSRLAGADAVLCIADSSRLLPPGLPAVLLEDMTIAQVRRLPGLYREWDTQPAGYVGDRERRQARQQLGAHAIGFLSGWARDSAVEDYGVDPARTTVIGVGSRFATADRARDWSTPRFLFVGLDWERKNGALVVDAFAEVRARHPRAELHLVGGHPPIDAPGVTGHGILLRGDAAARAKLAALYASSTCFVLPSSLEPAGVVYAEACSQGIPSIGTVHGGAADIVGDAGVAIDPEIEGELLAAMLDFADPGHAAERGALARRRAPMLTWDAAARRLASAAGWWDGEPVPLTRVTP